MTIRYSSRLLCFTTNMKTHVAPLVLIRHLLSTLHLAFNGLLAIRVRIHRQSHPDSRSNSRVARHSPWLQIASQSQSKYRHGLRFSGFPSICSIKTNSFLLFLAYHAFVTFYDIFRQLFYRLLFITLLDLLCICQSVRGTNEWNYKKCYTVLTSP